MQGASDEVKLEAGKIIRITVDDKYYEECSAEILWVDYKNITKVLKPGDRIFIDDGLISVVVKQKGELNNNTVLVLSKIEKMNATETQRFKVFCNI